MSVSYEVKDGIALITIERPEQRNAINRAVSGALFDAWRCFEEDKSARVAILTGRGEKAFSAGMDLKEAAHLAVRVPPRDFMPILGENLEVSKPTIAAVNGVAIAAGWLLAQMCDLCVASSDATFSITEARVGRGMPWASPLIHMLPQRIMLEILLTGKALSAQRLLEVGYVNAISSPGQAVEVATSLAHTIQDNAPLTVNACRRLVRISTEMGRSAAREAAEELFRPVYLSEDALEGPRAFSEKRKPVWRGL